MNLSASVAVWQIVEDVLAEFPPKDWMERMAVDAFKQRLLSLSEAQCERILEKVKTRLILTSLAR